MTGRLSGPLRPARLLSLPAGGLSPSAAVLVADAGEVGSARLSRRLSSGRVRRLSVDGDV